MPDVHTKEIHNYNMNQKLSQPLEIFSMNAQPFTCPYCGARCEEIASFYHTNAKSFVEECLNDKCGFIYFQEEDKGCLSICTGSIFT